MSPQGDEPEKLTEVEAKGASKSKANYVVLIVSTVLLIILFVAVYAYFA